MKTKPMTIILLGAIIVVIGGLIGAFGTYIHNKKSTEKSTRIEDGVKKGVLINESNNVEILNLKKQNNNLISQSNELNLKVETQSKTIDDLRKENTELYSKLSNSSIEIYNNLTGGDTRPNLGIVFYTYSNMKEGTLDPNYYAVNIILSNRGKYPLRNVKCTIQDNYSQIKKIVKKISSRSYNVEYNDDFSYSEFNKSFSIETISQGESIDILKGKFLIDLEHFNYQITVRWMKGYLSYSIDGTCNPKNHSVKIEKIDIFPLDVDKNINPLEYVDILPVFVGEGLKKYKNPFGGN